MDFVVCRGYMVVVFVGIVGFLLYWKCYVMILGKEY